MADCSFDQSLEQPTSIGSLSTEIVARIFEELKDLDPRALVTARRVCRAFNDIATPIAYETVHINQNILDPNASQLFPQALQHMRAHTRHMVLTSGFGRQQVFDFLNHLQKLQSIRYICLPFLSETPGLTTPDLRWSFISTGRFTDLWVPSDINYLTIRDPNKIKIHIQDLPIGALDGKHSDLYHSVIPNRLLVSLETTKQLTASEPYLPSLKNILLHAPSLEVFRYRDSGRGTQFRFNDGERLPPFRELSLRSYQWTHDAHQTSRHWDFSQIRSLELFSVSVFRFLSAVRLSDLCQLHTLRVDDASSSGGTADRKAVTALVHRLVRDHVRALVSLQMTCHVRGFGIDALLVHARTLRDLLVRDHGAFSEAYRPGVPTLQIGDLRKLAERMVVLEVLELDMDATDKWSSLFLETLCLFPQLHTLTLNIQTVAESGTWYTRFPDPDEKCVARILQCLADKKVGPAEWTRVTVKVGGWQSLMVRRVGEIWRALNRRGVFAKRCFVMERAAGGGGELVVREQKYVEMRLGRGYPWPG